MKKKPDPFQSGNEPLTDKEFESYEGSHQHTPPPWTVGKWKNKKGDDVVIKSGAIVLATMQWQMNDAEVENAAYIVRAVNCHQELLAKLKENHGPWISKNHSPEQCSTCKLIAKAEQR